MSQRVPRCHSLLAGMALLASTGVQAATLQFLGLEPDPPVNPEWVAISPDGAHVYVASVVSDAVAVFGRDAGTGALTFVESERNGIAGVTGLDGAFAVTVSPNGASVYVASIEPTTPSASTTRR